MTRHSLTSAQLIKIKIEKRTVDYNHVTQLLFAKENNTNEKKILNIL